LPTSTQTAPAPSGSLDLDVEDGEVVVLVSPVAPAARSSHSSLLAFCTTAAVLVEESRGADLLVVGSRGHGGFAQLLLGSVSQQCPQRAFCLVVIMRGTAKNGNEGVS
jgi:hypothetical protein